MACFLVDFENVCGKNGLQGVDLLMEKDILILFYSKSCTTIRRDYMEQVKVSNCLFQIECLVRPGKDALDRYISVELGYRIGQGESQIAIISDDKGFDFDRDYVCTRSDRFHVTLVRASNIENAIKALDASDDQDRRRIVNRRTGSLNIETEYAKLQAERDMKTRIEDLLSHTKYERIRSEIIDFALSKNCVKNKKLLYTSSLHSFGSEDGRAIYHLLKNTI